NAPEEVQEDQHVNGTRVEVDRLRVAEIGAPRGLDLVERHAVDPRAPVEREALVALVPPRLADLARALGGIVGAREALAAQRPLGGGDPLLGEPREAR